LEVAVHPTRALQDLGQSVWLDNITRDLLEKGTLKRYIEELAVTGLTSNPTILHHAVAHSASYDAAVVELEARGLSTEEILFELALQDLARAADLFAPIHRRTAGVDGFVSLEVSPLLAHDAARTVRQAQELHRKAARQNLLIKIPGTKEGLPAIEEAIFAGIPVNVTLLFSREQYLAAADAYQRGLERRVAAAHSPDVRSVASLFLSRWDVAVAGKVPAELEHRLGVAIGRQAYKAYRDVLDSERWQRLESAGARAQRLLFASTGTKDPGTSDVLYVEGVAAPDTVDTMPEKTLLAFADHGRVGRAIPPDGGDAEDVLAAFGRAGVDVGQLASRLQDEGARAFVASWNELISAVERKGRAAR
jgi:transaldolase